MNEKQQVQIHTRRTARLRRPPKPPEGLLIGKLKSERVEELLKAMPGWALSTGGSAIHRTRKFPSARVAGLYAGFVADFASSRRQGAQVILSGKQMVVTLPGTPLRSGRFGGLTESVFALARQLG
jgi:pterin-4a-carbinolamine dehydratase